jgi:hypothetical protein
MTVNWGYVLEKWSICNRRYTKFADKKTAYNEVHLHITRSTCTFFLNNLKVRTKLGLKIVRGKCHTGGAFIRALKSILIHTGMCLQLFTNGDI